MYVRVAALTLLMLGLALGQLSQRTLDPRRRVSDEAWSVTSVPRAEVVRLATFGQVVLAADLLWVRAVLRFADFYERPDDGDRVWLAAMIESVVELDPTWRTPHHYGASMLRVMGDIDGSDALLSRARAEPALAQDPYWAFAMAMNAWLHRDDPERAAELLLEASRVPGALPWYKSAAAGILDKERGRRAGIELVRQQLAAETDPRTRAVLEDKLKRLMHDELAQRLSEALPPVEERRGRTLEDLLAGTELPPDPLGRGWVIGATGEVRSRLVEEEERLRKVGAERNLLIRPVHTAPLPEAEP